MLIPLNVFSITFSNTPGTLSSLLSIIIFTHKQIGNLNIKTYTDTDPENHATWH